MQVVRIKMSEQGITDKFDEFEEEKRRVRKQKQKEKEKLDKVDKAAEETVSKKEKTRNR